MAKPLLPDSLWAVVAPLLPPAPPAGARGGRPRLSHRQALTGILYVLKTGVPWADLPSEMGCGCGMSCWRRLRDWQRDGTWGRVHAELLARLADAGRLDWSRCAVDSSSVRAVFGGTRPARTRPTGARAARSTT